MDSVQLVELEGRKCCGRCGEEKSLGEFYRIKIVSTNQDYLDSSCKTCRIKFGKQCRKEYRQNNKERMNRLCRKNRKHSCVKNPELYKKRHRETDLKCNYGITLDDYDQLFQQQNGVCAICEKPETVSNQFGLRRLSVDHDHQTGRIRGLLCSNCNLMIGHAKDNTKTLLDAVKYLMG